MMYKLAYLTAPTQQYACELQQLGCRAADAAYLGMSEAPEQQNSGFWQLLVHLGCVLIPSHLVLL